MRRVSPRHANDSARGLAGTFVALLAHAALLLALGGHAARASVVDDVAVRRATVRADRAAILRTAESDVASGRTSLGETLIRLGWLDRMEESLAEGASAPARLEEADLDRALASYRAMLTDVRVAAIHGEPVDRAIVDAVARDARAGRYKRMHRRLVEALIHGGGNCVALSTLVVTLAHDAGRGELASFRVYSNHVAPDVGGFDFGMAKRCHGAGVKVRTRELLGAYARARATADSEPFAFPHADEACDDPGDVFGDLQIVSADAAPARASSTPASLHAGEAPDCRRYTVLEEYEDDVEVLGADGRTLGGVGIPRAGSLDLAGHAKSAACFDRRVETISPTADLDVLVLALGDAALASEEAARVFAAAGELDVAREYELRLGVLRARAAVPLERVISRLSDPEADVGPTLVGAGRLVALGEGGRTAMLLAAERHSGFWELANLMTRPSSQVGAIKRWGDKPVDVRLDAIDMLPCASETFLAQLDSVALPAARTLRAACDARSRADQASCSLTAEALASARSRAPAGDRDAADLCEGVLVRRLATRCHTPAFVADARAWTAAKPEPLGRAVSSRIRGL